MTVQNTLFAEIFALWPRFGELANDMGVPPSRAYQWIRRNYLDPCYWPRLVDVIEQKFDRVITYRQLVEASAAQRLPKTKPAGPRRRGEGDGRSEAA